MTRNRHLAEVECCRSTLFFAGFNRLFERLSSGYAALTRRLLRVSVADAGRSMAGSSG